MKQHHKNSRRFFWLLWHACSCHICQVQAPSSMVIDAFHRSNRQCRCGIRVRWYHQLLLHCALHWVGLGTIFNPPIKSSHDLMNGRIVLGSAPLRSTTVWVWKGNECKAPNDTQVAMSPLLFPELVIWWGSIGLLRPRACAMYSDVNQGVTNSTVSQKSSCQFAPCHADDMSTTFVRSRKVTKTVVQALVAVAVGLGLGGTNNCCDIVVFIDWTFSFPGHDLHPTNYIFTRPDEGEDCAWILTLTKSTTV